MSYIDETGLAEVTTKLKAYADNTLNVPMEISTETAMNNLLVAGNVGKVYRYVGTTTANYTNGDLYEVEEVI